MLGANLRFLVSTWAVEHWGADFPYGTLIVNVTGAFAVGVVLALLSERLDISPVWRLFFVTGFLGGYTTFSAYAWETLALAEQGTLLRAARTSWVPMCLASPACGWARRSLACRRTEVDHDAATRHSGRRRTCWRVSGGPRWGSSPFRTRRISSAGSGTEASPSESRQERGSVVWPSASTRLVSASATSASLVRARLRLRRRSVAQRTPR